MAAADDNGTLQRTASVIKGLRFLYVALIAGVVAATVGAFVVELEVENPPARIVLIPAIRPPAIGFARRRGMSNDLSLPDSMC
jgi:hypothetical protein